MIRIGLVMLLAVLCGLFPVCNTTEGGTEIPNELTGNDGRFAFRDVSPGQYNLLISKDGLHSFRDSITVTGKRQSVGADTSIAPGSLTGFVELQLQHDSRSATVQVLGTTAFVNVARDGSFTLGNLGAGQHGLRVAVIEAGYAPLFKEIIIRAGVDDTLPEPLRPFYSGTPVMTWLRVSADPQGTLVLRWSKPEYSKVRAYLVYCYSAGTTLPSQTPMSRVTDTVFKGTIYNHSPAAEQHPYLDTAYLQTSGNGIGWVLEKEGFGKTASAGTLISFAGRLWIVGGGNFLRGEYNTQLLSTLDGKTWTVSPSADGMFPRLGHVLVEHEGGLWMMGGAEDETDVANPTFMADIWYLDETP